MIITSDFKPAWWLANAHGQTIYSALIRQSKAPIDKKERIELPDGDFIDLGWAINGQPDDAPLVILLHGLGGNESSTYIGGLMRAFNQRGWRALLMYFRGASVEPNRLARAYHSGDTADLDYLLHLLHRREPNSIKAAVGVSLGGNVLLKWLGEQGKQLLLSTAVAVSVPFELRLVVNRMSTGFSRLYQSYLLNRLKQIFEQKRKSMPEAPLPLQNCGKWNCFWTFDENVTAPLNGFANAHAYYREASSRRYLHAITTPTLIIHSSDDPFMTPDILPTEAELSDAITLELSARGGHVGFVCGNVPGKPIYWLEERIPDYLTAFFP